MGGPLLSLERCVGPRLVVGLQAENAALDYAMRSSKQAAAAGPSAGGAARDPPQPSQAVAAEALRRRDASLIPGGRGDAGGRSDTGAAAGPSGEFTVARHGAFDGLFGSGGHWWERQLLHNASSTNGGQGRLQPPGAFEGGLMDAWRRETLRPALEGSLGARRAAAEA